jgi:hypothetical protein
MARKIVKYALLISIGAIIALLVSIAFINSSPTHVPRTSETPSNTVFSTRSINSATYLEGTLAEKVSAHHVSVITRRFGLFAVRNVNELRISDLSIITTPELNSDKNGDGSIFGSMQKCLPNSQHSGQGRSPFGHITAASIDGFSLTSQTRTGEIILKCFADKAELKNKGKLLELINLELKHPDSGRKLFAPLGYWDETANRFEIPAEYRAVSSHGSAKGSGLAIDLYFNLSSLH